MWGKWGYINARGEEVIPLRFVKAKDFSANGLAAVRVRGKYGYIRAPSK
ncbi:MAG: WG repeat-containing protein [Zoogloeaceae bacterium]|nr:WG repeat-containing protein [Zoogloeaceae bacterium]